MCSNFRGVSQPKCRAVDKLVDEFVDRFCSKAGLKVTHRLESMTARLIPVQQTHPQSAQSDRAHTRHRLLGD